MPGAMQFRTGTKQRRCSNCLRYVIPLVEWDASKGSYGICDRCAREEEPFKSKAEIQRFVEGQNSESLAPPTLVNALKKKPVTTEGLRRMVLILLRRAPASRQDLRDGIQEIRKTITIAAIDHAINSLEKEGAIVLQSNRQFCIVENQ
jgi:hypothetical protein